MIETSGKAQNIIAEFMRFTIKPVGNFEPTLYYAYNHGYGERYLPVENMESVMEISMIIGLGMQSNTCYDSANNRWIYSFGFNMPTGWYTFDSDSADNYLPGKFAEIALARYLEKEIIPNEKKWDGTCFWPSYVTKVDFDLNDN